MSESNNYWPIINNMNREQVQIILENHGFAVYDSEDFDSLKSCMVENIESGEICLTEIN